MEWPALCKEDDAAVMLWLLHSPSVFLV